MSTVNTLTGKEIEFDIEPTDSMVRIKEKVEVKDGIPPAQQRLIYAGKQLGDDKTAKECNIDELPPRSAWKATAGPSSKKKVMKPSPKISLEGGSARAALSHAIRATSPQPVARSSRSRALVLPVCFREAALIDPLKQASTGACGKLEYSVLRCSVTSMDSKPPAKEELAELPTALNRSFLKVEGFGVGGIVWANCGINLPTEDTPVIKITEMVQSGVVEEAPEIDQGMNLLHQAVIYHQERVVPFANSHASTSLGGPLV